MNRTIVQNAREIGLSENHIGVDNMKKKSPKQQEVAVKEFKATALLLGCVQEMVTAREDFACEPAGVEPVHRFRVAIRRLRSLLSFF